jgi:RNA polymerase sigma-70 factor (ECF subfamily)
MITTRDTLLARLKAENAHDAWREFYHLYWGAILRYARRLGLNEHQAEEVLQETMVALMRILPAFVYDRRKGRFRNFLLTIVHRKSLAVQRRTRRGQALSFDHAGPQGDDAAAVAGALMAPLADTEAAEAEQRWRESLFETALANVRADPAIGSRTFAVFAAYALEQRPIADVAAEFGLKENAIYQIKNRLVRRVRVEVARLARDACA